MKIAESEYKEHIREKWIDACIYYEAMKAEAQKYGIEDIPTPTPTPTPDPQPEPTPTPTPEPSGEPAFVYDGPASYTISRGEHAKFTIYVNNATASDFQTTVPGDPECIKADDKWSKTSNGYMASVDVKGVNYGYGEYCLYWRKDEKDKDKWLRIKIIVNG